MKLNPDTRGLWYIYKATATMLLGCRSLLLLHLRRQFLCWRRVLSPCILGPCHIYQAIGAMHLGFRTFLLHLPCHQFLFVYQVLSSDILGPYNIYHIYLYLLIIFTLLLLLSRCQFRFCPQVLSPYVNGTLLHEMSLGQIGYNINWRIVVINIYRHQE